MGKAVLEKSLHDDDFCVFCPLTRRDEYVNDLCDNHSKGKCVYFVNQDMKSLKELEMECKHPDFEVLNY